MDRPTVAAVIRSGVVPYELDSRILKAEPPFATRTTWRTDWSANPCRDQLGPQSSLPATGRCMAVPHAPVHTGPSPPRSCGRASPCATAVETASAVSTAVTAASMPRRTVLFKGRGFAERIRYLLAK